MVSGNKRVLVVDDEEIVRDSCWRVLTDAGYTVRTVSNGRDALRACRSEPVDVILTDIRMPDMDGIQVASTIRKEFPDVRVLVITGYPTRESASQAKRLGIFDYLEKPLTPARLHEATAAALASPPCPAPEVDAADDVVADVAATDAPPCCPDATTSAPACCGAAAPAVTDSPVSITVTESATESQEELAASAPATSASPVAHPSAEPSSTRTLLETLGVIAVAPLMGLAFVVFLPLIGFGALFAALGSSLLGKSRAT